METVAASTRMDSAIFSLSSELSLVETSRGKAAPTSVDAETEISGHLRSFYLEIP